MKIYGLAAILLAACAGGVAFALSVDTEAHRKPEITRQGAALYEANCAACHGADLSGEPDWQVRDGEGYLPAPPHDETGHTWHHPTMQLFAITKYGTEAVVGGGYKSRMAGFGDVLTDEEILAVLAFIKSTWPRRVVEFHDEVDAKFANR